MTREATIKSSGEIAKLEKKRDAKKPKASTGWIKQQGSASMEKPHYAIDGYVPSSTT
jgi:hypothetical protein